MKKSKTQKSVILCSAVNKYPLGSTQNQFSGVQQPDLLKINPDFRGMLWMQGLVPVEGLLGTATLVLCAKKWGHPPST